MLRTVCQLVSIVAVCVHCVCALPAGSDRGISGAAVTGEATRGDGLLRRLNPLKIPQDPQRTAEIMHPASEFDVGQPSVGGLLGRGKDAVFSRFRPAGGLPSGSAASPALINGNEPADDGNNAGGDDEEEDHDEYVARFDAIADKEPNPILAALLRIKARVMAPRREVEKCPSALHRFFDQTLGGAKVRQGFNDYPSYVRRWMETCGMNVEDYFAEDD